MPIAAPGARPWPDEAGEGRVVAGAAAGDDRDLAVPGSGGAGHPAGDPVHPAPVGGDEAGDVSSAKSAGSLNSRVIGLLVLLLRLVSAGSEISGADRHLGALGSCATRPWRAEQDHQTADISIRPPTTNIGTL